MILMMKKISNLLSENKFDVVIHLLVTQIGESTDFQKNIMK